MDAEAGNAMTRAKIEAAVLKALAEVAPEVDAASLRRERPLRDHVDLDSFDCLNFFVALHKASGDRRPGIGLLEAGDGEGRRRLPPTANRRVNLEESLVRC